MKRSTSYVPTPISSCLTTAAAAAESPTTVFLDLASHRTGFLFPDHDRAHPSRHRAADLARLDPCVDCASCVLCGRGRCHGCTTRTGARLGTGTEAGLGQSRSGLEEVSAEALLVRVSRTVVVVVPIDWRTAVSSDLRTEGHRKAGKAEEEARCASTAGAAWLRRRGGQELVAAGRLQVVRRCPPEFGAAAGFAPGSGTRLPWPTLQLTRWAVVGPVAGSTMPAGMPKLGVRAEELRGG